VFLNPTVNAWQANGIAALRVFSLISDAIFQGWVGAVWQNDDSVSPIWRSKQALESLSGRAQYPHLAPDLPCPISGRSDS
jgi:hypothetical protein